MTVTDATPPLHGRANPHRFRLSRAGVLNVWQYDQQVFEFADGRLLLRGANGAGKSKTLEMLLPFALDGDKLRMTASGRHHTSLVWLMTDGYEGNRTGYLWVEFARETGDGRPEVLTCGVGIRASSSSKAATSWFFTCPRRVGVDLALEDDAGPLSRDRCRAAVEPDGQVFDSARAYRQHVGRVLFGLEPAQYDELLRLLYWLRQPQVGEDIEPARLADQLSQALPEVDDDAVRSAGDTLDELAAFGEQIDRRHRAAEAVAAFAATFAGYARTVARDRAAALLEAQREAGRRASAVQAARVAAEAVAGETATAEEERAEVTRRLAEATARVRELEASPEARSHQRLLVLEKRAAELSKAAEQAERAAGQAAGRAAASGRRVVADSKDLSRDLTGYATAGQVLVAESARAGVTTSVALPAALAGPSLTGDADAARLQAALDAQTAAVGGLQLAVGERLAAVQVVDQARRDAEQAAARRDAEERRAAEAEQRAERDRGRLADATGAAHAAESAHAEGLRAWQTDPRAVPVELPELTPTTVGTMAAVGRTAASPEVERLRAGEADAAATRVAAQRRLESLRERRRLIEVEPDPSPPDPALGRSGRDAADGAPLWRLVDFTDGLPDGDRAGLEAALEASGLLDAWVRTDGAVLEAHRLDVALPLGPAVSGTPTLAAALRPDGAGPVPAEVVDAVLARVAFGRPPAEHMAFVGGDGSWRLGPLVGRATKTSAQYVGATARATERARRLAAVDEDISREEVVRGDATGRETAARSRREALEEWLAAVPPHAELVRAWALLDERAAAAGRAAAESDAAHEAARRAREEAAQRRRGLDELADRHNLPTTAGALRAHREELRLLDTAVARHVDAAAPLRQRVGRWAQDLARAAEDESAAAQLTVDARGQREAADDASAEVAAVREAAGAGIEELTRRLAEAGAVIETAKRRERELTERLERLHRDLGAAETAAANAEQRRAEHQPLVAAAAHAVGQLSEAAGLVRSALGHQPSEEETVAFELARGVAVDSKVPAAVVDLARALAGLPEPGKPVSDAALFAAALETRTGDAADHEPRVVPAAGDLLGAYGRDDGGEHPVAVLAERLAASVLRDRELLTERERTLFEEHLIGDLGEMLRQRRLEAADLVEEMNQLLAGVTTSQGIKVRLHWQLRDDVPADVQRAVALLGTPVGALLPTERAELRDALHRLIEACRAESPEDSYTEHLAQALDYRRWFAFRIRYTRPEIEGRWQDLHRRAPLSQGEQKVVCYLPLFAAAAAHFSSLAGAAPHAPRFVLLDDAFPKIDVRTHPLLFGLLVALDLDFVVTSERLWGDHPTVPSLAIYEALRDPAERGVAQFRYSWDGARLQAVGA